MALFWPSPLLSCGQDPSPGLIFLQAALLVMTALTTLASVGGDLFISIHKRTVGLKDTGIVFPRSRRNTRPL